MSGGALNNHALEGFERQLIDAAAQMDIALSSSQTESLLKYLELLNKWNKTYNLTAVRDPEEMLWRHLIDSLSIMPFIAGQRLLDVGTGPGLPGIPIAILYPELAVSLLDSNSKKTRFLVQASIHLGLQNVRVYHDRVESAEFDQSFDQIVSRAFASLDKMVDLCQAHLADKGQFLAMKGLEPVDEIQAMNSRYRVSQTHQLSVPGCEAQRHLIIIERCPVSI